jgi:hypothetical protein
LDRSLGGIGVIFAIFGFPLVIDARNVGKWWWGTVVELIRSMHSGDYFHFRFRVGGL